MNKTENTTTENDVPMIPLHQAETMIMHMGRTNRNMMIAVITACAAMVIMALSLALIFVTSYNDRTKQWLGTYNALQERYSITEVADGQPADP